MGVFHPAGLLPGESPRGVSLRGAPAKVIGTDWAQPPGPVAGPEPELSVNGVLLPCGVRQPWNSRYQQMVIRVEDFIVSVRRPCVRVVTDLNRLCKPLPFDPDARRVVHESLQIDPRLNSQLILGLKLIRAFAFCLRILPQFAAFC